MMKLIHATEANITMAASAIIYARPVTDTLRCASESERNNSARLRRASRFREQGREHAMLPAAQFV